MNKIAGWLLAAVLCSQFVPISQAQVPTSGAKAKAPALGAASGKPAIIVLEDLTREEWEKLFGLQWRQKKTWTNEDIEGLKREDQKTGRTVPISVVGTLRETQAAEAAAEKKTTRETQPGRGGSSAPQTFEIDISISCDAGLFATPTWCPRKGEGVIGGIYREIRARAGQPIEITLNSLWATPGTLFYGFKVVPEGVELNHEAYGTACLNAVAGSCTTIAFNGRTEVRFTIESPGTYRYYDPTHIGTGYGELIVE
ncbi:MAG: hypothetical protein HY402_06510 [Elusimicrobia bacterium]|nr:hypothetical protein [Elusimicrobiota bacterium]